MLASLHHRTSHATYQHDIQCNHQSSCPPQIELQLALSPSRRQTCREPSRTQSRSRTRLCSSLSSQPHSSPRRSNPCSTGTSTRTTSPRTICPDAAQKTNTLSDRPTTYQHHPRRHNDTHARHSNPSDTSCTTQRQPLKSASTTSYTTLSHNIKRTLLNNSSFLPPSLRFSMNTKRYDVKNRLLLK